MRLSSQQHRTTQQRPRFSPRGFSLLELLVVVTIIGIFTGVVVLSMGVLGRDREIKHEALRLQSLMGFVRDEAVMQSRDYCVLFSATGYRFYVYDYGQMQWVEPTDDSLLTEHKLKQPLSISVRMEDRKLVFDPSGGGDSSSDEGMRDDGDKRQEGKAPAPAPQVVILSSGEITPFQASIYRDPAGGRFVLTASENGKIEIQEDGFAKGG